MPLADRCLVVPRLADCTADVTIEALTYHILCFGAHPSHRYSGRGVHEGVRMVHVRLFAGWTPIISDGARSTAPLGTRPLTATAAHHTVHTHTHTHTESNTHTHTGPDVCKSVAILGMVALHAVIVEWVWAPFVSLALWLFYPATRVRMCVCMYVCMYVCVSACMYVRVYVRMYVRTCQYTP
jgi:hypothetical protein